MKVLALVTDAFGGRGGIAQFNRDMLHALCADPQTQAVTALPRLVPDPPGQLPPRMTYTTAAAKGKDFFVAHTLATTMCQRFDLIVCGHLNLLPLAVVAAWRQRAPLVLIIYGIEAWKPPGRLVARLLQRVTAIVSISEFTKDKFLSWAPVPNEAIHVIPCCVDASRFGAGPKRADLLARYDLTGRAVIMTLARLAGEERYKGFDEVMAVLPRLLADIPNLSYLIVGDGPDRARLEEKARAINVADRVVFSGYIAEEEKADHYRLADLFVMPGRGEGFGIVYLEALACGIPVVASSLDASREAVRNGQLGSVVNPFDQKELANAILAQLRDKRRVVPEGLDYFSSVRFGERWRVLVRRLTVGSKQDPDFATAARHGDDASASASA
jgi:glycosyltransferase involved in cell wall biosynthesis